MIHPIRAFAAAASEALVPPRCAGCGVPGSWLCVACRDECEPQHSRAGEIAVAAAALYEGPLRDAIHRFKYRGDRGLAAELGALVARLVARDLALGVRLDAVVAVPLHPARVRERGYDQASLLAAEVSTRCGLPLAGGIHRIRRSGPQVELDRAHRARNVEGAFVATAASLRGLRIAIVDDVATTGATCAEVARSARAAGARGVRAYVVAIDE